MSPGVTVTPVMMPQPVSVVWTENSTILSACRALHVASFRVRAACSFVCPAFVPFDLLASSGPSLSDARPPPHSDPAAPSRLQAPPAFSPDAPMHGTRSLSHGMPYRNPTSKYFTITSGSMGSRPYLRPYKWAVFSYTKDRSSPASNFHKKYSTVSRSHTKIPLRFYRKRCNVDYNKAGRPRKTIRHQYPSLEMK